MELESSRQKEIMIIITSGTLFDVDGVSSDRKEWDNPMKKKVPRRLMGKHFLLQIGSLINGNRLPAHVIEVNTIDTFRRRLHHYFMSVSYHRVNGNE